MDAETRATQLENVLHGAAASEVKMSGYCRDDGKHEGRDQYGRSGCLTTWCQCECHRPYRSAADS